MSRLLQAAGDAPFIFVTGKGGVGKTTTAGALGLELADSGTPTHLISTDPAHSLADLFQHGAGGFVVTSPCSPLLRIEEFAAGAAGDAWVEHALGPVSQIVEGGTYLDREDVAAFSRLALPGIDEMMAVLRLVELSATAGPRSRVVVDTAPTGHTLRLLDAGGTFEGIARALRAMAEKASAVAGAMLGRAVRMRGEDIIEELEDAVGGYRDRVLGPAAFVVVTRAGAVVEAETARLVADLERRSLRVVAVVSTGPGDGRQVLPGAAHLRVPLLEDVAGCAGLRRWREHVDSGGMTAEPGPAMEADRGAAPRPAGGPDPAVPVSGPGPADQAKSGPGPADEAKSGPGPAVPLVPGVASGGADAPTAVAWLAGAAQRLLLFAGKGGVGKSTCAAAAAIALARERDVLLCSTDPAGSLSDVLGTAAREPVARLRVLQIEPAVELERLRDAYQEEISAALERVGLTESAVLDRRVIETLWHLTPPGIDELTAMAAMVAGSKTGELVVIDSSPTGHFLRLLEMPDIALGWTRQLMRIVVKYGIAGAAGGVAGSLLDLSRELRALRDTLHDAASSGVIIVMLDEAMVRAETERLTEALAAAGVRVAGIVVNRSSAVGERRAPFDGPGQPVVMHAPALDGGPVGVNALRGFIDRWNIVT
ncbi:MAG TPA: ArsA-related P-loop ATPase [Longimicrobiales bacterium]|nr:ArsA-related P-loop ATPase [Longimicrobiales bacterium]